MLKSVSRFVLVFLLYTQQPWAQAWVLNIDNGGRRLFLQVGNGSLNDSSGPINQVSLEVPVAQLGTGGPLRMNSNSTQGNSPLDNYAVCNTSAQQVYVGGALRSPNNTGDSARLEVASPTQLVNAEGDVIPINTISWTSTANGNATAHIPAGNFSGGRQFLRTIDANTYVENCLTFFYSNNALRGAGVYTGQIQYTLVTP